MTCEYDFVEGDTARPLQVPIVDETGAAVDLTGKTVKLRWLDKANVLKEKNMDVPVPLAGIALYTWLTDELYAPEMVLDVAVINADTKVMYSNCTINIKVREKLG